MWLSSRGTTHTPRDGAELRAKGVSEEGLGGHCRQQGRPSLCQGSGEAIRMSLPVGSLLSLLAWSAHWVSQVTRTSALGPGAGARTGHRNARRPRRAQNLWAWLLQSQEGHSGAPVSSQGSCCRNRPSHPRFPTPAPSSWSICPSCFRVARCGAFELCSHHQSQRCFHISSLSSWDRPASLLGQL